MSCSEEVGNFALRTTQCVVARHPANDINGDCSSLIMAPKGVQKTPAQLVASWKSDGYSFLSSEMLDGILHVGCSVCIEAAAGRPWGKMHLFASEGKITQKSDIKWHSTTSSHAKAVELLGKRKTQGLPHLWAKSAEAILAEKEDKLFQDMANKARSILYLSQEEIAVRKYPRLLDLCRVCGAENCETTGNNSGHSSVATGWTLVEAAHRVVSQENVNIIRNSKMFLLSWTSLRTITSR